MTGISWQMNKLTSSDITLAQAIAEHAEQGTQSLRAMCVADRDELTALWIAEYGLGDCLAGVSLEDERPVFLAAAHRADDARWGLTLLMMVRAAVGREIDARLMQATRDLVANGPQADEGPEAEDRACRCAEVRPVWRELVG